MLSRSHLVALLVFGLSVIVQASGDRDEFFQRCLSRCVASTCTPQNPRQLSFWLRVTGWSCEDDCKYECMHSITDAAMVAIQDGIEEARVQQYYGKWPFWRFLGMQEPASVLFSLFNLWAHWTGGRRLLRNIKTDHPMYPYYAVYVFIGLNAWVWSAVFHTRDKPFTEKLDYFSAASVILYSLFIAVVRLFRLYRPPRLYLQQPSYYTSGPTWLPPRHILLRIWAGLCALLYLTHVLYLSLTPRFDYGYNVIANLIVGLIHNAIWATYSFRVFKYRRFDYMPASYIPEYGWIPAACVAATTLAMTLELFDFPPWSRILDAHSLWHLSTPPLVVFYYDFLLQDAKDRGWSSGRGPVSKILSD